MTDIATVVRVLTILLLIALVVILISRRLSVPYTLGLVVVGLVISLWGTHFNFTFRLDPQLVLFVFLPALIFEGAWSISVTQLRTLWRSIFFLIGPGLLLVLLLIALPLHFFVGLDWSTAFLLSAILTPTDPVAVLGLFRQLHVNEQLATIIEGESLLNDGIAGSFYQVFLALSLTSTTSLVSTGTPQWLQMVGLFLLQLGGGIVLGASCGFIVSRIVKRLNEPLIETTITLVTAYAVYLLADALHTSGILAVIIAGLIIGSYGRRVGMSKITEEAVQNFWSVIAFVANALLFLLVGVQLNPLSFLKTTNAPNLLLTASLTIVAVLLARFMIVLLLPRISSSGPRLHSWRFVIFWSGLRGALSLALVLALPLTVHTRDTLIFATYAVILFTLLVQGFSLRFILRHLPSLQA